MLRRLSRIFQMLTHDARLVLICKREKEIFHFGYSASGGIVYQMSFLNSILVVFLTWESGCGCC